MYNYNWTWEKINKHYQGTIHIGEDRRPSWVQSAKAMLDILLEVRAFTENHKSLIPYLSHSALCLTNHDNGYSVSVYFDTEIGKYQTSYYEEAKQSIMIETDYLMGDDIISFMKSHLKIS